MSNGVYTTGSGKQLVVGSATVGGNWEFIRFSSRFDTDEVWEITKTKKSGNKKTPIDQFLLCLRTEICVSVCVKVVVVASVASYQQLGVAVVRVRNVNR